MDMRNMEISLDYWTVPSAIGRSWENYKEHVVFGKHKEELI
jgi:hypothetical protein